MFTSPYYVHRRILVFIFSCGGLFILCFIWVLIGLIFFCCYSEIVCIFMQIAVLHLAQILLWFSLLYFVGLYVFCLVGWDS